MKKNFPYQEAKQTGWNRLFLLFLLSIFISYQVLPQDNKTEVNLNGQAIAWSNLNFSNVNGFQVGGRYIPEFSAGYMLNGSWKIDGEFSLNAYKSYTRLESEWSNTGDIKPYRMWIRLSEDQFELRAGLQKINFGSASMLRPLMWFDRLDPRDPLQLTDGVYGLLLRYYFINNTNLWFWGLLGNDDPRGWDQYSSGKGRPEMGGRIQMPLLTGELGLSYHHRFLERDQFETLPANIYNHDFAQDKFAFDGKWDVGPGIWIESVFIKNNEKLFPVDKYQIQFTLGCDYTFGIGNGLTTGFEHLVYSYNKENLIKKGDNTQLSAFNLNYPVGMIDNVSAILFYSWDNESLYRFLNWGRQYDRISFFIMAYWNPEGFDFYPNMEGRNLFGGKGIQLMFTYNH